jgi:hypothetical protein
MIEKYSADRFAKNVHGQVAFDLVTDPTPQWRQVFADKKPEQPMTFRIPPAAKKEPDHHTPMGSLSAPRFVKQAETPTPRAPPTNPMVPATIPQLKPLSTLYAQRFRQPINETWLVSSVGIMGNDDLLRQVIPFTMEDIEEGYVGHSLYVPANLKSVNIRLALVPALQNVQVTGYHNTLVGPIQTPLAFKSNGSQSQDCQAILQDSINAFEMIVTGYQDDEYVCQSVSLFITRY